MGPTFEEDDVEGASSTSPPPDTAERATPPPLAALLLTMEASSPPPRRRGVILSAFLTPAVARPKTAGEKDDDMTGDERRTDTPAITLIGYFIMVQIATLSIE